MATLSSTGSASNFCCSSERRRKRSARIVASVVTRTPKCSSASEAVLIASSPSSSATSVAISTLVSRTAFNAALPGIHDGLINQVYVTLPIWVGAAGEQAGDVGPLLPAPGSGRNQTGRESTSDGDLNFLSTFDSAHKFRRILAKFSQSHGCHGFHSSTSATMVQLHEIPVTPRAQAGVVERDTNASSHRQSKSSKPSPHRRATDGAPDAMDRLRAADITVDFVSLRRTLASAIATRASGNIRFLPEAA